MSDQQIRIDDGDGIEPPENYTGEWTTHWPNRKLKYRALYLNGKTEGEVLCCWDNGQIAQRGVSDAGVCRGVWTDYFEDGRKFKETDYRDNSNFTVRYFGPDGDVLRTEVWQDGDIIHEEGEDLLAE
jgi:antitoxin component YwqK of YwqJK toxin-antitoxin module